MRAPWAILIILAATAPAAADRPLELQEIHRAGQESPRLELQPWKCTLASAKTVIVEGRVKNIAGGGYTMKSWFAYIEVLDKDSGVIGKGRKPLEKTWSPNSHPNFAD